METKKKLPIGMEFFSDIRTKGFYYVDKTAFIRDLLASWGSINLFTRPRRFGKSLNMDMLKSFFEIGTEPTLFDGLEIAKDTALCEQYMGKYPVISISLKDVSGSSYEAALKRMSSAIRKEARRHQYLLESDRLRDVDKETLKVLYSLYLEEEVQEESLYLLSEMLHKHYGKKVIILIDEYDVPLDKAYQRNYYSEMVNHIRVMFSEALKTNVNLEFAVITGCLRIAKESIFTGLNNFKVRTISDADFAEYFGFTDGEVREILHYYGIEETYNKMKEWYDGYQFGHAEIYCPWDILNQCDKFRCSITAPMEAHWENSSSNGIVQDILENSNATVKDEIEALISGQCVEKALIPELTYTDLESKDYEVRQNYLWSVLFYTGYLTEAGAAKEGTHKLVIPNREVRGIFEKRIRSWFRVRVTSDTGRWECLCSAVKNGEADKVQAILNEYMEDSISIRDTCIKKEMKENFYHGMLLGLFQAQGGWIVKSNSESGVGYVDIEISVPIEKTGCIIEVKYAENGSYDATCKKAMKQIEKMGYTERLKQSGIKCIHKYGIACYRKNCKVEHKQET
jgi:hypothetical protein